MTKGSEQDVPSTISHFVCTVGPDKQQQHLYVQLGDPGMGITIQLLLTPKQCRILAKHLINGALAVEEQRDYQATESDPEEA